MVAISAVQSSAQTFIHNAILFIDISDNVWYNQAHWLIRTPYLSIIASNGAEKQFFFSFFPVIVAKPLLSRFIQTWYVQSTDLNLYQKRCTVHNK